MEDITQIKKEKALSKEKKEINDSLLYDSNNANDKSHSP